MFRNLTFRRKITLNTLLTAAAALLVACVAFIAYDISSSKHNIVTELSTAARIVGDNSTAALSFNDNKTAEETLRALARIPLVSQACIYDADGKVFAIYNRDGAGTFDAVQTNPEPIFNNGGVEIYVPITDGKNNLGTVFVHRHLRDIADRLWQYIRIALLVLFASLLAAWCAGTLLARQLSRPVEELRSTAARFSDHRDYNARARKFSHDELGQLTDTFNSMLADISARDAELRRSEARFRGITENTSDLTFILASDGSLAYHSPAFEHELSYPTASLHSHPLRPLVHSRDWSVLAETLKQSLASPGQTLSLPEFRIRHHQGHWIHLEGKFTALQDTPGVEGTVGNCRDITARKIAEKERENLIGELKAKNTELERFTYTVSHDLKSPLITIKGFLGLLEMDAANPARLKSDIDHIAKAADKMLALLGDLLELSRVGRIIGTPVAIPFGDIVKDATDLVAGRIRQKNVSIAISSNFPRVMGDRTRLLQVVQNLLDNAVKYMGDQPAPAIEVGWERHSDTEATFHVTDNGQGIETRHQQKVFGLFQRLGNEKEEGTGVGLALVQRIVEVHGGRIWVESLGLGHGSTFFFILPCADEPMPETTEEPAPPIPIPIPALSPSPAPAPALSPKTATV